MTNRTAPRRPTGLSGQEEEELRTLEKGYDPDAGALPDQELTVHDDRDRKPGDDAMSVPDGKPDGKPEDAGRPLKDAQRKGLLPSNTVTAPPTDRPDDAASGPANLDPDPGRRRP